MSVQPRGTHHERPAAGIKGVALPRQLCASIGGEGVGLVVFGVVAVRLARKDVVGGQVDELGALMFRVAGDVQDARAVDEKGVGLVALAEVDIGLRSAVDDEVVGMVKGKPPVYRGGIGDVELSSAGGVDVSVPIGGRHRPQVSVHGRECSHELRAKLTASPRYQYMHCREPS